MGKFGILWLTFERKVQNNVSLTSAKVSNYISSIFGELKVLIDEYYLINSIYTNFKPQRSVESNFVK